MKKNNWYIYHYAKGHVKEYDCGPFESFKSAYNFVVDNELVRKNLVVYGFESRLEDEKNVRIK